VGTAKNMAKLVPIGLREHWLIDPNELQIFGDGFLGEGAFGVVMAGCLHGTHVAVKLPSAKKSCECCAVVGQRDQDTSPNSASPHCALSLSVRCRRVRQAFRF